MITRPVDNLVSISIMSVSDVKETLNRMAEQRHVTVDELTESAKTAGTAGAPYQVRVLNLLKRLDVLGATYEG